MFTKCPEEKCRHDIVRQYVQAAKDLVGVLTIELEQIGENVDCAWEKSVYEQTLFEHKKMCADLIDALENFPVA